MTHVPASPVVAAALLPWSLPFDDTVALPGGPLDHVLGQVRHVGFTAVDLTDTCLPFGDLSAAAVRHVQAALAGHQLAPAAISVIRRSVAHPNPDVAAANLAYTHRAVDVAAALGAPVVSVGLHCELTPHQRAAEWFWAVPGHRDPDDPTVWQRAVRRLQELADHAAAVGLELSLEMYEDTYLGTAASALRLLEAVDRPNAGLNPDTGNLVRAHRPVEPWEEVLAATLPRANYWHLKNYLRSFDPATGAYFTMPAPLETGVINYRRAIEIAVQSRYQGGYCLEHYGGDGLGVSIVNRKYLHELFRAALPLHLAATTEGHRP